MKGFFNKLLRVDLSQQRFSYEEIEDDLLQKTLGGKGLGTHLLLKGNPPNYNQKMQYLLKDVIFTSF